MGASMGLATYLRTNRQIGGIIALYGSNPLDYEHIDNSTLKIDGVPMLFGNSQFLKNTDDIKFTADWFSKNYFSAKSDLYTYFTVPQLGDRKVSNIMNNFLYKNSKWYPNNPRTLGRNFGKE